VPSNCARTINGSTRAATLGNGGDGNCTGRGSALCRTCTALSAPAIQRHCGGDGQVSVSGLTVSRSQGSKALGPQSIGEMGKLTPWQREQQKNCTSPNRTDTIECPTQDV
jgi:hypothetical protein